MSRSSRPAPVQTPEESGEAPADPSASDAHGTRGAPRSPPSNSPSGLHMRSSHSPRRSSSGYFSNESNSVPASPVSQRPPTADEATQTVSPSAQVIEHALTTLADDCHHSLLAPRHGRRTPGIRPSASMRDTRAVQVGRELRAHGDEFNRILTQRAGGQWRPPREPTVLVCVGLLIFFVGRLLYTRGIASNHSQV